MKTLMLGLLLSALVACSGGGGSAGTNALSGSGSTSGSTGTGSGSSTGSTTTTTAAPTVQVSIQDASGASVSRISVAGAFSLVALVRDASGTPISNKLVTFQLSADATAIAKLNVSSALTNGSGIAQVTITPLSVAAVGAGQAGASASVSGTAYSGSLDFGVAASNLTLSALVAQSTSLLSAGNTSLQTTASVGGVPTSVPVNVVFTAACGRINGASAAGGVSVTTNGSGIASATYDATSADGTLCSGSVQINAASAGAASVSTTLNVAAPTASTVAFLSANPAKVFVAGSGALERSEVSFKVFSSTGAALPNVNVDFSIVTNPGGVGIGASGSTSPVTAQTDASGIAKVSVFSGTIPGPVKLRAALTANSLIFSESQNLTVASGPASQRFMSLAVSTYNIEGWVVDGSSTRLTVRIADRQGNAVENGTVVNFTAEGGQVASSCATTQDSSGISSCSVDFITQNPRPNGGRASVLAYLEGTKDYLDVNNNNKYDQGIDTLLNIGNAYRDDNEDGMANAGEFIVPRGGSGVCSGSGGAFPKQVDTCDPNLVTTVRQQAIIQFSSSTPFFDAGTISTSYYTTTVTLSANGTTSTQIINRGTGFDVVIRSNDNRLLPMPAGTTIGASTSASGSNSCAIVSPLGGSVPNIASGFDPLRDLATVFSAGLKDCFTGDRIIVTVTSPGGLATTRVYAVP